MNHWRCILLTAASLVMLQSAVLAQKPKADKMLGINNCFTSQGFGYYGGKISIGEVVVSDWLTGVDKGWIMWKIPRGYTIFTCDAGIVDGPQQVSCELQFILDGEPYKKYEVLTGQKPQRIDVPVSNYMTLRINCKTTGDGLLLMKPRLQFIPPPRPPIDEPPVFPDQKILIDSLTELFRKKIDTNITLKYRVDQATIGITTFRQVDIGYKSVADGLTEDLYISMINAGFRMVERGQFDNVMKELQIQNTWLMDPQAIQKIGQLSGCELIVVGSISDRGQFLVVNCRMIDTQTGKSLITGQVEMRKTTLNR